MKHPLDEEFDVAKADLLDIEETIEIPEIKNLDLIVTFALQAYKEQMDIVGLVEPKNKIKYLEIAERYLGQAKDAMYKKEYLMIQQQRANTAGGRKTKVLEESEDDKIEAEKNVERSDLYEELKLIQGGKVS